MDTTPEESLDVFDQIDAICRQVLLGDLSEIDADALADLDFELEEINRIIPPPIEGESHTIQVYQILRDAAMLAIREDHSAPCLDWLVRFLLECDGCPAIAPVLSWAIEVIPDQVPYLELIAKYVQEDLIALVQVCYDQVAQKERPRTTQALKEITDLLTRSLAVGYRNDSVRMTKWLLDHDACFEGQDRCDWITEAVNAGRLEMAHILFRDFAFDSLAALERIDWDQLIRVPNWNIHVRLFPSLTGPQLDQISKQQQVSFGQSVCSIWREMLMAPDLAIEQMVSHFPITLGQLAIILCQQQPGPNSFECYRLTKAVSGALANTYPTESINQIAKPLWMSSSSTSYVDQLLAYVTMSDWFQIDPACYPLLLKCSIERARMFQSQMIGDVTLAICESSSEREQYRVICSNGALDEPIPNADHFAIGLVHLYSKDLRDCWSSVPASDLAKGSSTQIMIRHYAPGTNEISRETTVPEKIIPAFLRSYLARPKPKSARTTLVVDREDQ